LHAYFTVPELVELGFFVALTLGQQRWIKTLGIGHGEVLGGTTATNDTVASARRGRGGQSDGTGEGGETTRVGGGL
jgi:hypothetical protein